MSGGEQSGEFCSRWAGAVNRAGSSQTSALSSRFALSSRQPSGCTQREAQLPKGRGPLPRGYSTPQSIREPRFWPSFTSVRCIEGPCSFRRFVDVANEGRPYLRPRTRERAFGRPSGPPRRFYQGRHCDFGRCRAVPTRKYAERPRQRTCSWLRVLVLERRRPGGARPSDKGEGCVSP